MDNLLHLALEAHSDEQNHHRRYELTLGQDLLDCWTLTIRYGRVGRGGHEKRYSSQSAGEIRKVIAEHLRRRRSAPRRIGCQYLLLDCATSPTVDVDAWVSPELIVSFSQ